MLGNEQKETNMYRLLLREVITEEESMIVVVGYQRKDETICEMW